MKDLIHIVPGPSSEILFRELFTKYPELEGKLISLEDDLRVGPINNLDTESGRNKRVTWLNENICEEDFSDWIWNDNEKLRVIESELQANNKICIWYG